jgi:hypothetical protein
VTITTSLPRELLALVPTDRNDITDAQRGAAALPLRYEDVSQDGRLACTAMTHGLGAAIWDAVLVKHPMTRPLTADGVVPILSRLSVVSGGGPIGVFPAPRAEGWFALLRTPSASRTRYRLDMRVTIEGVVGHTHGPRVEGPRTPTPLGVVHAEHVLTRPFGPPERRQVNALPEGVTVHGEGTWTAPDASLALPEGATPIDRDFVRDPNELVLGLGHTDSNQHVNSLVYPAALEEAALRRLASLGEPTARFAHHFELAFRKPSFAGERLAIDLCAYRRGRALGVIARFIDAAKPNDPPRTFGRLELVP